MSTKKHSFDRYPILWAILNLTSLIQLNSRGNYAVQPSPTTNASTNYFGASIFISYIIAALILTYLITGELDIVYRRVLARKQGSSSQWRQFKTCVAFSSISFGVLSWNMLNFLITSYNAWSSKQHPALSTSPSYLDIGISIWQWTIHSTLFLDFARSLCATRSGYWWVMQALMATMTTNVTMQAAGKRWKVKTGYYVAIGQILPISLAMNLFSVAIVLAQMEGEETTKAEVKKKRDVKANATHEVLPLWVLGVVMILYRVLLYLLPRTPDDHQFMAMVLTTRFALYTVSLIEIPALDERLARYHLRVLGTYGVQELAQFFSRKGRRQAWSLVESPAVTALSVDYVLWFVSVWVLNSSGLLGSTGEDNHAVEEPL